jgi:zinc protease
VVKDYKGRAVLAQGEVFDPSPANIEARTQRFTLANGMKAALLPKKTKGGTVSATSSCASGTADALQNKATPASSPPPADARHRAQIAPGDQGQLRQAQGAVTVGGGAEGVPATMTTTARTCRRRWTWWPKCSGSRLTRRPNSPSTSANAGQDRAGHSGTAAAGENAFQRMLDATPDGHVKHVR